MVGRVDMTNYQSRLGRAINEADDAVVPKQQRLRDVADRRRGAAHMAANGEEELVLRGRDADTRGLLLTPVQELA